MLHPLSADAVVVCVFAWPLEQQSGSLSFSSSSAGVGGELPAMCEVRPCVVRVELTALEVDVPGLGGCGDVGQVVLHYPLGCEDPLEPCRRAWGLAQVGASHSHTTHHLHDGHTLVRQTDRLAAIGRPPVLTHSLTHSATDGTGCACLLGGMCDSNSCSRRRPRPPPPPALRRPRPSCTPPAGPTGT